MKIHRVLPGLGAAITIVVLCLASATASDTAGSEASADDIRQETAELLQALKRYSVEQRDEALRKIEAAQANLDRRIEKLEDDLARNWDQMDQAARERARESLRALREQRTRVAEYYGSLRSGSAAAWGHIKQGFVSAYEELQRAWQKAEQESAGNE